MADIREEFKGFVKCTNSERTANRYAGGLEVDFDFLKTFHPEYKTFWDISEPDTIPTLKEELESNEEFAKHNKKGKGMYISAFSLWRVSYL